MKSKNSLIARVIGIVTALILVISVFSIINRNFIDIPLFSMVLSESEIDEFKDELDAAADELEEIIDDATEEEEEDIEKLEEVTGWTMDEFIETVRNPSINGIDKLFEGFFQNPELEDVAEELGISEEDLNFDDEMANVFGIIRAIIIACALFILLFVILGICFNKKAFPILAIIFSAFYFIFLAGMGFYVAFIALSIVQMVFMSMAKKEKKNLEQMKQMQLMQEQMLMQQQMQQQQIQQQQMDNMQ